jgi:hypothetical protein
MYNADTELLFPIRLIPTLANLRGERWQKLVTEIGSQRTQLVDELGFVLFMVRLGGCVTCNADSFRAMRGCTQCAFQTIRRFRGQDDELIEQYQAAKQEVEQFLSMRNDRPTS